MLRKRSNGGGSAAAATPAADPATGDGPAAAVPVPAPHPASLQATAAGSTRPSGSFDDTFLRPNSLDGPAAAGARAPGPARGADIAARGHGQRSDAYGTGHYGDGNGDDDDDDDDAGETAPLMRATAAPSGTPRGLPTAWLAQAKSWLGVHRQTMLLLGTLVLAMALATAVRFGLLYGLGYPVLRTPWDPPVIDGSRGSGRLAWGYTFNSTRRPHPYNSDENLAVRDNIIGYLRKMQAGFRSSDSSSPEASSRLPWSATPCIASNESVILLERDPISAIFVKREDIRNLPPKTDLYESTNVLFNIEGTSPKHEALLISAHYDSVPFAPGVTDNGIAVGAVLAVAQSLLNRHCHSPLQYDVIFNFNNAEEMGLLGARTFIMHPWFKNVKAFINLEGTGATQRERSLLFRTNAKPIMDAYMNNAPFPHASVIANYLMSSIPSDTDFSPYTMFGRVQGIDVAFYANRYLYHTMRDDMSHGSAYAAQHMVENTLRMAIGLAGKPSGLADFGRVPSSPDFAKLMIPTPNFAFYDIAGMIGIVRSNAALLAMIGTVLATAVAIAAVKLGSMYYRLGYKRLVSRGVKPFFESLVLVWFSFLSVFPAVYFVSSIKHHFNPAASYGRPLLSLAYTIPLMVAMFSLIQIIWPWIAVKIGLRTRAAPIMYHELPTAPPPLDRYDDAEDEEEAGAGIGPGDASHGGISSLSGGSHMRNASQASLASRGPRNVSPTGPSLASWLPFGLLGFWISLSLVNLFLVWGGNSAFYFLYIWAFYSGIACVLTLAIESSLRRWYRFGITGFSDEGVGSTSATSRTGAVRLEHSLLAYYENYFWLVNFGIATAVPFVQTLDMLHMLVISLPSLVAEGIPGQAYDTLIALVTSLLLINTLPVLSMCHRRVTALLFFALFGVLWITAILLQPFSPDRPQKMVYMEVWNVSDVTGALSGAASPPPPLVQIEIARTMSATRWKSAILASGKLAELIPGVDIQCDDDKSLCTIHNPLTPTPGYGSPENTQAGLFEGIAPGEMITLNLLPRQTGEAFTIEGTLIGPPNSRICQLTPIGPGGNSSLIRGFWVDPWEPSKWQHGDVNPDDTPDGAAPPPPVFEQPGNPTPGVNYSVPLNVYRREFEGQGLEDHRIRIPFLIHFEKSVNIAGAGVAVSCFLNPSDSPTLRAIEEAMPSTMLFASGRMKFPMLPHPFGRSGPVAVSKTMRLG